MSPVLSLYLGLSAIAAPAARIALRRRLAAGKEDAARLPERMGIASLRRPEGSLAWFHAASVGEGLSLLPLLEALTVRRPDLALLITTGTVTSAQLLEQRLPPGAVHQYAPIDVGPAVCRFLDAWKPDLAVWTESEIWPRMVWSVGRRGIPALLINARLSERSRARWQRVPGAASELFAVFDYVQAQDDRTGEALRALGVPAERLCVAGSFKQAAAPLPHDPDELAALRAAVRRRPVWVAASTHAGEEEFVLAAHRLVVARRPDALLLLVPRHPARGDAIADLVQLNGLLATRRRDGPPGEGAEVYLADTLGELGLWYRLAGAAYVGGSTGGGIGGHNPYEPVVLSVPVLHGPDTANFAGAYEDLDAAGGALQIESPAQLAEGILDILDGPKAAAMIARARDCIGADRAALDRAIDAVLARLPALNADRQPPPCGA